MYFQKVIKGINGLSESQAREMITQGIICNWWRNAKTISPAGRKAQLIEKNVDLHLNHYGDLLPPGHPYGHLGKTYGDVSPFISTTAGAIERDEFAEENIIHPPLMTALRFATKNFTENGTIFYAYVMTLGKKAVELEQFSEEVRELNIYNNYLQFYHEGEIMAKIIIPSVQIEKAEVYLGPTADEDFKADRIPMPYITINNPEYLLPEKYSNIREVLSK
jgi:hypothetical protein